MQQAPAVLVACSTESNITAWDLASGSALGQFKGNASGRGRLCRVGPDYVAAAQGTKDTVHFWTWGRDQVLQRSFAQEPLTALAASPGGAYLAAGGASGSLYVWCTASGALLRAWPAHYKAVSCLAFSDSGGVLVSGGEDALVCSWLLAEVLDAHRDNPAAASAAAMLTARVQPLHTWSEHTLAVTCLCLGMGEGAAVLATASLDRSVKLWSLATGQLLRSLTLPAGVTSVAMDAGEHVLLAGCADGSIYEASLVGSGAPPAAGAAAAANGAAAGSNSWVGGPGSCCFEGHTKAVSCLCVTADGERLVSGAEDGSVRVWDLRSRQCLRTIAAPSKAPVSGLLLLDSAACLSTSGASVAAAAAAAAAAASTSGGGGGAGKPGARRLQPLATLAKYAGAAGSAKPWEGPVTVLDAGSCGAVAQQASGSGGLFLQPWSDPLQALQHTSAGGGAAGGGAGQPAAVSAADAAAAGGSSSEEERLRSQLEQAQAQLAESRRVASHWQDLHAQLHQFCTEQVLTS